jgi:hypothetical protein
MDTEFNLYDGKSFKDLLKDIVVHSDNKRDQIDIIISDLQGKIKTVNDAVILAPIIHSYIDTGVKNDEQLIKLAAICQRFMNSQSGGDDNGGQILTDEEKADLLEKIKGVEINIRNPVT